MRIDFLGTGTSFGVPILGCECSVCKSSDIHNKRMRASVLIEKGDTRILVDCGPDFRQQMLSRSFSKIDAVFITHTHYDHVGGIDDLRPFCRFGEINIYSDNNSAATLRQTMPYCFCEHLYPGVPHIAVNVLEPHKSLVIGDITITPIEVMHGKLKILGYRFDDFLYITDMKTIDDREFDYLSGVKVLVVNALRFSPQHHSHMTVDEALAFARRVGAKHTYFTHVCHGIGLHDEVNSMLPDGISLAYDGEVIEI